MSYRNNLRKGDTVQDSLSGRRGTVQMNPRHNSVNVSVRFEGNTAQKYVPVGNLRLVVDGHAEDVPPVEGAIPGASAPDPSKMSAEDRRLLERFTAAAVPAVVSGLGFHKDLQGEWGTLAVAIGSNVLAEFKKAMAGS